MRPSPAFALLTLACFVGVIALHEGVVSSLIVLGSVSAGLAYVTKESP